MAEYAIETRSLTKQFGKATAFTNVSLQVPTSSITCLLGPSDAGKSTLLHCLLQIARPSSGSGSILGLDIAAQSMEVRQKVGFAPENPTFDVTMTPYTAVHFATSFLYSGDALEEKIARALEMTGFKGQEKKPVRKLERPERARLAVAQAFAANQPVVLLDQPTRDLDPLDRDELMDLVQRFQRENNATVLYASNLVEDAPFADRLAYLIKGRLVMQTAKDEITKGAKDVFDQRRSIETSFKAQIEALKAV
ncbi:MAG: ABC transporter ATP-binding protein [Anaerolineae bacterium]|nr:ABC transporter ATP-binding protein [Anaerolineae bacterium]